MTPTRICVLDDYQGVAEEFGHWGGIRGAGGLVTFVREHLEGDRLVKLLCAFDVVCAMRERTQIDRELLSQLPNLRLIVTAGARNDAVDVAAANAHGVLVCGTRSPAGFATAELALAMILALARNLLPEVESVRAGGWQWGMGTELRGSVLGVVGLGKLGTELAQFGRALGMEVQAWSPHITAERAAERGVAAASLDALLGSSDVVSVHLRLAAATRSLIGERELDLMRPTAILVNTSRGPIVDARAAVTALRGDRLGGLAMDVYDQEPLPADGELRLAHPHLITTPHIGFVTRQTYAQFYREMCEDIEAWQAGTPMRVITA